MQDQVELTGDLPESAKTELPEAEPSLPGATAEEEAAGPARTGGSWSCLQIRTAQSSGFNLPSHYPHPNQLGVRVAVLCDADS